MTKKTLIAVGIILLTATTNVLAVGCGGLVGTKWKDRSDKVFGQVGLRFDYESGDPSSNAALINYTLEYTMNGSDHFIHGATTINVRCTNQPNGTAYIQMGFDDGVSNITLQGSDEKTFNVVSGSQLNNGTGRATALKGPFTRV